MNARMINPPYRSHYDSTVSRHKRGLDNLSTHFRGSLYQAFTPYEAPKMLRRLELDLQVASRFAVDRPDTDFGWLTEIEKDIALVMVPKQDR
jgi:hypothetical protein